MKPIGSLPYKLLLGSMMATHAAGSFFFCLGAPAALLPFGDAIQPWIPYPELWWRLGWTAWCLGDLLTPWFLAQVVLRHAGLTQLRGGPLRLACYIGCGAAALDFLLNLRYALVAIPLLQGESLIADPRFRFLSLSVANSLFFIAYVLLSWVFWRRRQVRLRVTVLGLAAWLGAAGITLNGFGLWTQLMTTFGTLFTTGFVLWIGSLYLEPGRPVNSNG